MWGPKSFPTPFRVSILSFALFILIGSSLLMLPAASMGKAIGLVDALFTATSAACVTGLVVLDTGKDFSLFGQFVILIWIQAGGLGIMTLSTVSLLAVRKRPSLAARMVVQDTFTHSGDRDLRSLVLDVIRFTVIIEGAGALLLFVRFVHGRDLEDAIYLAVFHAISAFCNAGFSTFPDNLEGFVGDWLVSLTVCFLIVSGGIGFVVMRELRVRFPYTQRTWPRLSLHSKLVLSTSAALVLVGMVLILVLEWGNSLKPFSMGDRLLAAFFQSVTPRTAGFNTVHIGAMANQTLFLIILLMFIGASPGSTGGGVKTTTLATLVALGWGRLRGVERPQAFRRAISVGCVARSTSVVMVCALLVIAATMILQVAESGSVEHARSRVQFLELLFEAVSAFGTVGLSMGITPGLTDAGKLIITLLMFLGRLGPLMVVVAMSRQKAPHYQYAEEGIMIG